MRAWDGPISQILTCFHWNCFYAFFCDISPSLDLTSQFAAVSKDREDCQSQCPTPDMDKDEAKPLLNKRGDKVGEFINFFFFTVGYLLNCRPKLH